MEEDIDKLEELLKEFEVYGDLDGIAINDMSTYMKALEHLIKAYKELEEENKIIKGNYYTLCADIQMVTSELGLPEDTIIADEMVSMIKENYIEKSLVEEKIEELNKQEKQELKGLKGQDRYFVKQMLQYKRSVLQELLERINKCK